jgi:hypothetical protein
MKPKNIARISANKFTNIQFPKFLEKISTTSIRITNKATPVQSKNLQELSIQLKLAGRYTRNLTGIGRNEKVKKISEKM